jgi:putative protein kinase ArgK-like GTPase of G3E family
MDKGKIELKALKDIAVSRGSVPAFNYKFSKDQIVKVPVEHMHALLRTGAFELMDKVESVNEVHTVAAQKADKEHQHVASDIIGLSDIKFAENTLTASEEHKGKIRYVETTKSSSVEMCMRTSANNFKWVVIKKNTW